MQCVRQFARCTGPLWAPGRQSRKDVESKIEFETTLVKAYLEKEGFEAQFETLQYARVKCKWKGDGTRGEVVAVDLIPRLFPLRLGSDRDFKSQGKASNQMNALFFSSGHVIQAMDCNMGIFLGECFKVPFLIREFLPPVKFKLYREKHGETPRSCWLRFWHMLGRRGP